MSLMKFECLALIIVVICFRRTFCVPLDKIEHSVTESSSGNIKIDEFVVTNKTFGRNENALELRKVSEVRRGIEGKNGGRLFQGSGGKDKNKKKKNQKGFMQKMLPMMIIPFMVSTSIVPMMLITLKLMILKSAFIAKIGILLMLLNMFRRRTNGEGGVFNHNVNVDDVAMEHYGYRGDAEYGAYVNRKKRGATKLL